ncbi:acyl carrier protein [Nonomuraea sp. NPDC050663]|uniref:acyl carrier protein n=1 Tax=Nonomuraea sp. NPDC050663 TaxID=3364370 RepID=UPI0037BA5612
MAAGTDRNLAERVPRVGDVLDHGPAASRRRAADHQPPVQRRPRLGQTYLAVGGDSLTAVFIMNRLRDDFDLDVPATLFLEDVSLREVAARIVEPRGRPAGVADGRVGGLGMRPVPPGRHRTHDPVSG